MLNLEAKFSKAARFGRLQHFSPKLPQSLAEADALVKQAKDLQSLGLPAKGILRFAENAKAAINK